MQTAIHKKHTGLILGGAVAVPAVLLFVLYLFAKYDTAGPHFSWTAGNLKDSVVQVASGKPVIVPFEFKVGTMAKKLRLSIKEESLKEKGIYLEESVLPVENGKVSSNVIFNLGPESGMKAGRYHLTIIARESATDSVMQEGEIPFALDILDLIWKCSC